MTTIAWIEDDYDEIAVLVSLLEADEYVIKRFRTRDDAENRIDEICKCDAILLDIILPPIIEEFPHQGVLILRKLRDKYMYNGPVIVCSVVRAPGVMDELRKLGVLDENILHKPVRPSMLTKTVKKALDKNKPVQ